MYELDARLDRLTKPQRTAACCVWLEHVLPLYVDGDFGIVTDAHTGKLMQVPEDEDLLQAGLQLVWTSLESRLPLGHEVIVAMHDCDEFWGNDGEDRRRTGVNVHNAFYYLLKSIEDPTPHAAREAGSFCRFAIAELVTDDSEQDRLMAEERAWQLRVLDRIEGVGTPVKRAQFSDLLSQKLAWHALLSRPSAAR